MRERLGTILVELREYVYLDVYEEKNATKRKLKDEIDEAIDIVDLYSKNNISNLQSTNIFIVLIKEMFDDISESNVLDKQDKKDIINTLLDTLKERKKEIENVKIDSLDKYNDEFKKTLSAIVKIKLDTTDFINEKKYYLGVTDNKSK